MKRTLVVALVAVLSPMTWFAHAGSIEVELSGFRGNGGRVAWSPDGTFVVLDRRGSDGGFDLHLTRDFVSERCLTCDHPDLPNSKRNYGQPAVHPDGRWIVFQAEKQKHRFVLPLVTNPGAGVLNDIWLYDLETDRARPLWELPNSKHNGVLHPHFSKDGSLLSWSEMYRGIDFKHPGKGAGSWKLKVATFTPDGLNDVREFQPGEDVIYENHGFSHDGEWLFFSSNMKRTVPVNVGTDVYKLHLATGEVVQLTHEGYNEHAHLSPDGRYLVWMSSVDNGDSYDYYKVGSDYWIMNADGSDKQRLTYLNKPGHPHFRGRYAVVADFSWDPASSSQSGYRMYAYLHELVGKNFGIRVTDPAAKGEYNFMVEFAVPGEVTTEVVGGGDGGSSVGTPYLGYYAEDPVDNPEDPVGGFISAALPASGPFLSEMLFSYLGCGGGVDSGEVSGTRDKETLQGMWSGTTDGVEVSGEMSATRSDEAYVGTYRVDGGKRRIGPFANGCAYYIAGHGTFRLEAIGEEVSASWQDDRDVRFTCEEMEGAVAHAWSVVEADCLSSTGSLAGCSVWHGSSREREILMSQGTTIRRLLPSTEYVVGCIGFDSAGAPLGIATGTFTLDGA